MEKPKNKIKIIYFGSAAFAVPALKALKEGGHIIPYVVTQPDRIRARGGRVLPTPVGLFAEENGLELLKPERIKDNESFMQTLAAAAPDLIVVAAYGKILPKPLLELPPLGCVNIHASLLPEYRGAAPVQSAILDGIKETGVTLAYMASGIDSGDVVAYKKTDVGDKNAGELTETLARLGAELLKAMLPALADGTASRTPQDEEKATYAGKIGKADGHIDISGSAEDAVRRVRAMTPSPGAYVLQGENRIVITKAKAVCMDRRPQTSEIGAVQGAGKEGISVRTGEGVLLIEALKMPGKKAMPAAEYLKGNAFDINEPLR